MAVMFLRVAKALCALWLFGVAVPVFAQVHPAAPAPREATEDLRSRSSHSSTYIPRQPAVPPALGGPSAYQPGVEVERLTREVAPTPTPIATPKPVVTPLGNTSQLSSMIGQQFGAPASQPVMQKQPAGTNGSGDGKLKGKSSPAFKPVIIHPPDNGVYVAVVGNRFLSKSEMDMRVNRLLLMTDQIGWKDKNVREQMRAKIENMVLTEWIELTLLAVSAEKQGFNVSEAEIQEKLNEIYQQEQSNPGLQNTLQAIGMSRTELLESLHDAALAEKIVNKRIQEKLTETDLKNIYQSNRQAFVVPMRADLNFMVLRMSGQETLDQRRQLQKQMENWQKKAAKKGRFLEVAKEFNQPEVGQWGGHYGWATPRSLPRQASASGGGSKSGSGGITLQTRDKIVETVFSLKPGEVSKVLAADSGFYVFQMINIENGTGDKYETAKPRVQNAVYEEAKKAEIFRAANEQTVYYNAGGLDFDSIAQAKMSGKDIQELREEQRKQKFMEHFRDRLLAAAEPPSGKAVVAREATSAPTAISQKSLEILKKYAQEHPEKFVAP